MSKSEYSLLLYLLHLTLHCHVEQNRIPNTNTKQERMTLGEKYSVVY